MLSKISLGAHPIGDTVGDIGISSSFSFSSSFLPLRATSLLFFLSIFVVHCLLGALALRSQPTLLLEGVEVAEPFAKRGAIRSYAQPLVARGTTRSKIQPYVSSRQFCDEALGQNSRPILLRGTS